MTGQVLGNLAAQNFRQLFVVVLTKSISQPRMERREERDPERSGLAQGKTLQGRRPSAGCQILPASGEETDREYRGSEIREAGRRRLRHRRAVRGVDRRQSRAFRSKRQDTHGIRQDRVTSHHSADKCCKDARARQGRATSRGVHLREGRRIAVETIRSSPPMKRAIRKANLDARDCFYALRHAYISEAIENNVPLTVIAENCGTSVRMIEETYAKVLFEKKRDFVEQGAPKLR